MASDTGTERAKPTQQGPAQGLMGLLRSRITLVIVLINAIALTVTVIGVSRLNGLRESLVEQRVEMLTQQAVVLAELIAQNASNPDETGLQTQAVIAALQSVYVPDDVRVRVFNNVGVLIPGADSYVIKGQVDSADLPDLEVSMGERIAGLWRALPVQFEAPLQLTTFATLDDEVRATIDQRPTLLPNGQVIFEPVSASERRLVDGTRIISVSAPIQRVQAVRGVVNIQGGGVDQIVQRHRDLIMRMALFAALIAFGSSVLGAFLIARPIRRLSNAAYSIRAKGPKEASIPSVPGKGEIAELSRALSAMTNELARRIDTISKFSEDVAHELKNPLTLLRSAVESLALDPPEGRRERLFQLCYKNLRRIDQLITDISEAAQKDAELASSIAEPLDLQSFLRDLVEGYQVARRDDEPDVIFECSPGPAGRVSVNAAEDQLHHVFRNLIDNARTFSPADRPVRVILRRTQREGRSVILTEVEDGGPGLPDGNVDKVFDRFFSERPKEHGDDKHSGLGLAIARDIVQAHEGEIWASNIPGENGAPAGARFSIALPILRQ